MTELRTQTPEKTPGLKANVQSLRDEARNILRMQMINSIMNTIFDTERSIAKNENTIESSKKDIELEKLFLNAEKYDLDKLDKNHPLYERHKEDMGKRIEQQEKNLQKLIEINTKHKEQQLKENTEALEYIKKLNKKIEDIENGEKKVSINNVDELVKQMLDNMSK